MTRKFFEPHRAERSKAAVLHHQLADGEVVGFMHRQAAKEFVNGRAAWWGEFFDQMRGSGEP